MELTQEQIDYINWAFEYFLRNGQVINNASMKNTDEVNKLIQFYLSIFTTDINCSCGSGNKMYKRIKKLKNLLR